MISLLNIAFTILAIGILQLLKDLCWHTVKVNPHNIYVNKLVITWPYHILATLSSIYILLELSPAMINIVGFVSMLCFIYIAYCRIFDWSIWNISLVHAVTTATLAVVGLITNDNNIQQLMVINTTSYLLADLLNPNSPIFVFHHVISLLGAIMCLLGYFSQDMSCILGLAEWTVPFLYMVKQELYLPWSYVGLLTSHIVFRIIYPFVGAIYWYEAPVTPITYCVYWSLFGLFFGLQCFWCLKMIYMFIIRK